MSVTWTIIIALSGVVVGPAMTLLGIMVKEHFEIKKKKMDKDDESRDEKFILECRERHKKEISVVREEFNERLNNIEEKMDVMAQTQQATQKQIQNTQLQITRLRAGVEKNNGVIERTFKLEQDVNALKIDSAVNSSKLLNLEKRL